MAKRQYDNGEILATLLQYISPNIHKKSPEKLGASFSFDEGITSWLP